MKKHQAGMGALLGAFLLTTLSAGHAATGQDPIPVVGTFDSRAVAMAYIRSEATSEYLGAQKADVERILERARTAGDGELVRELEALGPAMQERFHHMGFGTAPVDDLIATIEDRLPDIAKEAGVDVIVSRWVLTYRAPAAQLVDVTDHLVAAFDPSEATLEGIRQLLATDPVPLDEIEEDH